MVRSIMPSPTRAKSPASSKLRNITFSQQPRQRFRPSDDSAMAKCKPGAMPIEAPENRLSDGVTSLAPFAPADAVTIMKWDADPDVQHWYDWPLTPRWDDPATYQARLA